MTISGAVTKWQIKVGRIAEYLVSLLLLVLFGALFQVFLRTNPGKDIQIMGAVIFSVVWALVTASIFWDDKQKIVEFTCDESSFRFRRVGSANIETRAVFEIVKIQECHSDGALLTGYILSFQDGTDARLPREVPNSTALVEYLLSTHQGIERSS